jgi:hypothetical protein
MLVKFLVGSLSISSSTAGENGVWQHSARPCANRTPDEGSKATPNMAILDLQKVKTALKGGTTRVRKWEQSNVQYFAPNSD